MDRWRKFNNLLGRREHKSSRLTVVKLLLNSVISTPEARFMTGDIKNFYLGTPMMEYEYMRVPVSAVPDDIMEEYNLHNGYLYVEVRKGMYGLPQAGRLANDLLTKKLAPHGYHPCPITPGLWKHETNSVVFTLVVDDFGVKYTDKADAEHLMNALKQHYEVTEDWTGSKYLGLSIDWDYQARTCDISMPGYVERALQRFQHPNPTRPQHSPHAWQPPNYGATIQYAATDDNAPLLNAEDTRRGERCILLDCTQSPISCQRIPLFKQCTSTTGPRRNNTTACQWCNQHFVPYYERSTRKCSGGRVSSLVSQCT
jgi:hypothetical protein